MNDRITVEAYRQSLAPDEDTFQADVIRLAEASGWLVFHVADSRKEVSRAGVRLLVGDKQAKGYPDLTMVNPSTGRFLVRELKSNTGRVTPEQKTWLAALQAAGIDAGVWRPRDIPAIELALTGSHLSKARSHR